MINRPFITNSRIKKYNYNYYHSYRGWRIDCLIRDNYICQICGRVAEGVHHKISISTIIILYCLRFRRDIRDCVLLWDRNNGISLCNECHKRIENAI